MILAGVLVSAAGVAIAVWGLLRGAAGLERRRLKSLGTVDAHREVFRE